MDYLKFIVKCFFLFLLDWHPFLLCKWIYFLQKNKCELFIPVFPFVSFETLIYHNKWHFYMSNAFKSLLLFDFHDIHLIFTFLLKLLQLNYILCNGHWKLFQYIKPLLCKFNVLRGSLNCSFCRSCNKTCSY